MTAPTATEPRGILIIRLGSLGDVANVLPSTQALRERFPAARIGWLVESPSDELVRAASVCDEIIVFPRKRLAGFLRRPWRWPAALAAVLQLRRVLRAPTWPCVLDFQGNLKSGCLARLSGAPYRLGFARGHSREMNWLFHNILALPPSGKLLRAERNAALAQVLAPGLLLRPVALAAEEKNVAAVERFLRAVPGEGPLVVLHPGTSAFGRFKRWPAARFGQTTSRLQRERRARCVVTYGPDESALAGEVVASSQGAARLAPAFTLGELVELLRRASLVIAADTGPLHVAALLQRPVVAIFGPKDPAIYAPYGTRSEIVRADIPCGPCAKRNCDHVKCMENIQVADVVSAAERLLKPS